MRMLASQDWDLLHRASEVSSLGMSSTTYMTAMVCLEQTRSSVVIWVILTTRSTTWQKLSVIHWLTRKKFSFQTQRQFTGRKHCAMIGTMCTVISQYEKDATGIEQIRRPSRSWADRKRGIDCDCMSVVLFQPFASPKNSTRFSQGNLQRGNRMATRVCHRPEKRSEP